MSVHTGRHHLQIPGPTHVPDRVLRAIDRPVIDHRGPEFQAFAKALLTDVRRIFKTTQPVVIYPASGTGAWEAALVNTLSPGDRVLMAETGQFAILWKDLARHLGLEVEFIEGDWRHGVDPAVIADKLEADRAHTIKAVAMVHNETASGITSDVAGVRRAIDGAHHPALLMVDTISGLGSIDYRHDEWGVDVTIAGSQKGLMLPPGLSFTAISAKALAASETARLPRAYWRWEDMLTANTTGFFPYTPATNLLFGLAEAIKVLEEEGLDAVFARHIRHGAATRAAVRTWGLEIAALTESEASPVVTTVLLPEGHDADRLRGIILERFDMSLGKGLGRFDRKAFRIGHLGHFNDLGLVGTLAGVEMGLSLSGVPHAAGGVAAAMAVLAE